MIGTMNDIKSVVAKNIVELRQAKGMTQLELGEKLNYSDKAVSKWEHGDSMPDISVLVEMADMFGVTIDYLVRQEHKPHEIVQNKKNPVKIKYAIITAVSILLVWFIAVASFVYISTVLKDVKHGWLTFIYAVPVSAVVWLVFNTLWFNRKFNYFIISLLMWATLAAVHISFLMFSFNLQYIWMVYLLGIPGQVIILLLAIMRKVAKK